MIIPFLVSHQYRNSQQAKTSRNIICNRRLHDLLKHLFHPQHSQTDPDRKSIKRSHIRIIPFTWLLTRLVEVNHNGHTGEKEQEHIDDKVAPVSIVMIEQTD